MKKGKTLYFFWSASDVMRVIFVRWCRMKMHTGSKDTNKIGVGAIVKGCFFSAPFLNRKQRSGLPRGYIVLRPYTDLFYRNPQYRNNRSRQRIARPKLSWRIKPVRPFKIPLTSSTK